MCSEVCLLVEIRQAVENHPETTACQLAGLISWSARGLGLEQFPPRQKWFAMGETQKNSVLFSVRWTPGAATAWMMC